MYFTRGFQKRGFRMACMMSVLTVIVSAVVVMSCKKQDGAIFDMAKVHIYYDDQGRRIDRNNEAVLSVSASQNSASFGDSSRESGAARSSSGSVAESTAKEGAAAEDH